MVLCGHWHPACLTSFSTHWNAAGLNRLISGIDVTTRQLERDLLFRISPLATNLAAQCRYVNISVVQKFLYFVTYTILLPGFCGIHTVLFLSSVVGIFCCDK